MGLDRLRNDCAGRCRGWMFDIISGLNGEGNGDTQGISDDYR
jgi:hypothetical protein